MAVTHDPSAYARTFDSAVPRFVSEAARRAPGLSARLRAAGVTVEALTNVAALDRLPVLTKDEVIELQAKDPPFGGLVAADARPLRVFQSPGPIYEVQLEGLDQWRWAPALEAAGFTAHDVVLNAFAYHLTPAGAMFEEACRKLGATVFPAGVGNLDAQVRACADLAVTAYVGTPSYLKALLEAAELRGGRAVASLRRAFVTAEPLPESLRGWLLERLEVVLQGYGTAETGNLGFECSRMQGWHVPDDALVQVCDVDTGVAIDDERQGQVVATVFTPAAPVLRFGTGDLSAWHQGPCSCGLGTPRLRGWLGRVGDGVKVRGMFLHPRQVAEVMAQVDGVSRYRFTVERTDHRDVLRCTVVAPGRDSDVAGEVRSKIRASLRFDVDVQLVGSLSDAPIIEDLRTWS